MTNPDLNTLVLAFHPLSSSYRRMLEDRLGARLSFCLVADLRDAGIGSLARRLLHSHCRRIVIPYEVPEAQFNCLPQRTGFPKWKSVTPQGTSEGCGCTRL
jgi:hypothetical protein